MMGDSSSKEATQQQKVILSVPAPREAVFPFSELPVEIRLLIWKFYFDSFFETPRVHTFNGSFIRWNGHLGKIVQRGVMWSRLADRYGWRERDLSRMRWKTIIHDVSPHPAKVYLTDQRLKLWPALNPMINYEALGVAKKRCEDFKLVDLWLDPNTTNVTQPAVVNVASDIFRFAVDEDTTPSKNESPAWLSSIRRLAIGPLLLTQPNTTIPLAQMLMQVEDLTEVYILLPPSLFHSCVMPRSGPCDCVVGEHILRQRTGLTLVDINSIEDISATHWLWLCDEIEGILSLLSKRDDSPNILYAVLDCEEVLSETLSQEPFKDTRASESGR
ncbi:hypothetical protein F5Y18DRAFT_408428 [Xylariaceae sp. FL1019]|nr:hypothetical protein F5Y18DRAFT_408428 [Xylariaceae sp. FL1019]